MNINGQPLDSCSDQDLRTALDTLYGSIPESRLAQVKAIEQELERRAGYCARLDAIRAAHEAVKSRRDGRGTLYDESVAGYYIADVQFLLDRIGSPRK